MTRRDKAEHSEGGPREEAGSTSPAPDERDATIERLERALAEERDHTASLRKAAEDARFKSEILERSYAKQLEDARLRGDVAESELAQLRERLKELEAVHEDAMRLLAKVPASEQTPADRALVKKMLSSTDGVMDDQADDAPAADGSMTINKLMRASDWANKERAVPDEETLPEQPEADDEAPPEDMLAPDLVFTAEGGKS